MAAIFQLRRGSTNVSLTDGELYLHNGTGSIQFGSGSNNYTLLPLNTPTQGDINLIGNISASGDVRIGGNIYLGNASADNISALGQFTTNLIPNGTIDIGTTSAPWTNVYANNISASSFTGSFSGSIGGIDFNVFSTSVDSRLDQLETDSGSQNTRITTLESKATTLETYTASIDIRIDQLATDTGSQNTRITTLESKATTLETYTTSVDSRLSSLETDSGSQNTRITTLESKATTLQTYTASVDGHISDINTKTGSFETKFSTLQTYTSSVNSRLNSVENYTQSLRDNIEVGIGNIRILGDLIVDGDTTYLNTANLYVEDKVITLASGSTNSGAADGAGFEIAGANVSMSWQNTNNRFEINTDLAIKGYVSASTFTGLNGDSLTTYSTSVDSRLTNLQSKSASVDISISEINNFTSSQNQKDVIISNITASYNGFTGSATASIVELFSTASNHEVRIDDLESKSVTLGTYTASVNGHIADINSYTSSNDTLNTLQTTRIDQLSASTASVNSFSASATASIVELFGTASNHEGRIDDLESKSITLQSYTASVEDRFTTISNVTASLNLHTASLNLFTSSTYSNFSTSVDSRLDQLEYTTSILTPEGQAESFGALNAFTASANNRLNNLELTSASLNLWSSSLNTTFATDSELNAVSLSISTSVQILSQSVDNRLDQLESDSGSQNTRITTLESKATTLQTYTASINSNLSRIHESTASLNLHTESVLGHISDVNAKTASFETKFSTLQTYTASINSNLSRIHESTASLNVFTSSANNRLNVIETTYATTGSNTFIGTQVVTGSMYVSGDLIVQGSSSLQNISASAVDIGANIIYLNTDTPAVRFGGISVFDSGSTAGTGSLLYDSENERWIYQKASGSSYSGGMLISGPRNNGALGEEVGMPNNKLIMGIGGDHISSSNIYHNGTDTAFAGNVEITGSTILGTANITTLNAGNGVVSGSSQVLDMLSSLNTYTGSNDTLNTLQTTRIDQLSESTASVNSFTASIDTTIKTKLDVEGVVSGSSQISLASTNGFGTYINQSVLTSSNVTFANLNVSSNIKTNGIVNDSGDLYIGPSADIVLSGDSGYTRVQNNDLQVTGSIFATNGIYGSIAATNGVVSGSSQITLSSTTGGGTTSNVQFGSLGIGTAASGVSGEIRATGDIIAFYSSDERLKENITPIENAVDKINQMGGYTYDWKDGFETIHSHKGHDLGVIAQEVQSVLPEVVTERETGYLAVDYVKLVPVLIEAIKELSAKIDRLESK